MGDQRFALGDLTETEILADSGSLVSSWPADSGLEWVIDTRNYVTPYALRVKGMGSHTTALGETTVSPWIFDVLSAEMFDYLATTVFGGAQSVDATILTFNQQTQEYECYQCIATLNEITPEAMQPWQNSGFQGARIEFSNCELNTE